MVRQGKGSGAWGAVGPDLVVVVLLAALGTVDAVEGHRARAHKQPLGVPPALVYTLIVCRVAGALLLGNVVQG